MRGRDRTVALAMLAVVGCSPAADGGATVESAAGAIGIASSAESPALVGGRYVVAATGNEVRYRVREQLVGFDLPNDAIGKSAQIIGGITLDDSGRVVREASRFTVDAATFVSDRDRRDNYVRGRLLTAAQHPTIELVPTALRGLAMPPSGSATFQLVGDLTVRGVTRPTTWSVTAQLEDEAVTGSASTRFAFTDFEMEKPRVRSVLSVADTIALEYDFNLVREAPSP
ncbi:MAG TPA: YceI family protein [Gemmatimonadaceae bacterium]|nr:YceI family protein [Gemmatimonadaceae bacterium]